MTFRGGAAKVLAKLGLPPTDTVRSSYSAALVGKILLQGRLYVTDSALGFYANIFGRVTVEVLPWARVAGVAKTKAGLVANALRVELVAAEGRPPLVFGSMTSREKADDGSVDGGWLSPSAVAAAAGAGGAAVWATAADVWDAPSGAEAGRHSEVARAVLPGTPAGIFNALFVGDWVRAYHAARGNREVVSTRVVETHTYSFTSPPPGASGPGVLVEYSGHNLDVPFADAFRTETAFALTPVDSPADAGAAGGGAASAGGAATLVAVSAGVHFTRAFPLRGK
ncbi:hypothetical protein I4F81_010467 [Pyropia yezoensis]|uniref:Uncharacterized protein n=1 Tax=Pyropia yezoensis TaxID=2788 RepID=A0ACC3CD02_PYRYE|nr:hypothetical protein I4F81_010467 [Neopyropia yezoensis]